MDGWTDWHLALYVFLYLCVGMRDVGMRDVWIVEIVQIMEIVEIVGIVEIVEIVLTFMNLFALRSYARMCLFLLSEL